jgi:ubiquinone biosynthesis O-methyltransferase
VTGLEKVVKYENVTLEDKIVSSGEDDKFDLVCCSEVIEHVSDQGKFLKDCLKMVKPNGLFFVSTISKTPEAYFTNILMGEYVLGLLPKGTHEYDLFMT